MAQETVLSTRSSSVGWLLHKIPQHSYGIVTHTMNVCRLAGEMLGCRLTMGRQSETNWQSAEWRSGRHAGRSYGALIPLLDNNSRIHLIPWEMPLFIQFVCQLWFNFQPTYSYSYMTIHIQNIFKIFTYCIIPMDYIPTFFNVVHLFPNDLICPLEVAH